MNREKIQALLDEAYTCKSIRRLNKIQTELVDMFFNGEVYPISGPIAERINAVSELYVKWLKSSMAVTKEIVNMFEEIIG
jgi:hypothetical protein